MDSKTKIMIDLVNEKVTIFAGKHKVGDVDFLIDETQIIVVNLTVVDDSQSQGYGSLLLHALKGISQFYKKPIYLISYPEKIGFYEKNEFFSLTGLSQDYMYEGKKINIKNLNPKKTRESQIGNVDMLWVPPMLNEVDVYL